jgi:putative ABC transport system ATP-binding protein
VFQSVNLVPFLTAEENLTVVGELAGRPRGETRERARRLLDELGLARRAANLATDLSGGERQRVAIGRALMNEPTLVLVDEPTSALDTRTGEAVMELLRTEITGRGVAAVVVTHDTRMASYTDRTVEIVDGRLRS